MTHSVTPSITTAPAPLLSRPPRATSIMKRPAIASIISPNSTLIRRMFSRMSPFRMWLNSWATTPCSSSRDSRVSVPRVTAITASLTLWPAAKALMPASSSMT